MAGLRGVNHSVLWTSSCFIFFVAELSSSPLFEFIDSKHNLFSPGPLTAPLNLRVSDIESTQVTVHWDPVVRNTIMGELKEYKVCLLRM